MKKKKFKKKFKKAKKEELKNLAVWVKLPTGAKQLIINDEKIEDKVKYYLDFCDNKMTYYENGDQIRIVKAEFNVDFSIDDTEDPFYRDGSTDKWESMYIIRSKDGKNYKVGEVMDVGVGVVLHISTYYRGKLSETTTFMPKAKIAEGEDGNIYISDKSNV